MVVRVAQKAGKGTMKSAGQDGSPRPPRAAALLGDARANPRPLVIAALAQALQGLLLFGIGLTSAVTGITGSDDLLNAELVGLLAMVGGVGLLGVARGLLGAKAWSRAPALVWQLIMIPVGFSTVDDVPGVAYPLLVSAAVVLGGVFSPSAAAMTD
jgi:hypothetical protein